MKWLLPLIALMLPISLVAQERQQMPVWSLETEQGQTVRSVDFTGKPVVIHFWATWCPYCKKLQPELDRLYREYKDDGLEVIGISIREDEGAIPQQVLVDRGFILTTLVNGEQVADKFFVSGTPTTVFVDKTGNIIGRTNSSDPDDPRFEKTVKKLLE